MSIAFPSINPIIISLGFLSINWYSLSYIAGILLGWILAIKLVKHYKLNINTLDLENLVNWIIVGIIFGGRIGYIILYNPVFYFFHPIEMFKIYKGGMSFHGGVLGVSLALYFFSKRYKLAFFALTDIIASVCPIGLFLGRIANFINAELYGRVTNIAWGVIFPNTENQIRHASQLYEAFFEGAILFLIIIVIITRYNGLKKLSFVTSIFLVLYSIIRIILEFFREPDINIGFIFQNFTMGQVLSIPMLILGLYIYIKLLREKK